jgi:hypothetical protein
VRRGRRAIDPSGGWGSVTRPGLLAICALIAIALAIVLIVSRCGRDPEVRSALERDAQVRAACGSCHAFAPPEILPRFLWRTEIERMAKLVEILPGADGRPAARFDVEDVVDWYEGRAPERLAVEPRLARDGPPLRFERRFVLLEPEGGPGVATVQRLEPGLLPGFPARLASANMASGAIHLFSLTEGPRFLGSTGHPVRTAAGDLDGDGRRDLVLSDLGQPMPTDEPTGRVVAALQREDGSFGLRTLLEGIGRVADARPVDLDRDGDLDVVVAAFGMYRRGGVYILHNESAGALEFRAEQISDRPGAVSVIPVDDLQPGSGRGFVVAFAQHHELVAAYRLVGGSYAERVLYRAPHPNWGTSHLAAVDLDADGDTDFLLSHGDTLDDGLAFKPYHGVEWLENLGDGFRAHSIGPLYGAHAAEAGDLDGDGDLDVVASGFLPQVQLPVPEGGVHVDSVIWFEQTGSEWIPWSIESDHPRHTGLTLVDLDDDGRLDIVAAINRAWDIRKLESGPSLEVWLNRGPRSLGTEPPAP